MMRREVGRGVPQNANSLVEMSLKLARLGSGPALYSLLGYSWLKLLNCLVIEYARFKLAVAY